MADVTDGGQERTGGASAVGDILGGELKSAQEWEETEDGEAANLIHHAAAPTTPTMAARM